MYPFVILPGPHGYMIQPLDLTEISSINKEYEEMLRKTLRNQESMVFAKRESSISLISTSAC